MIFQTRYVWPFAVVCLLRLQDAAADDQLQEVVVTATLRDTQALNLPESLTLLDDRTLQAAGVQHFEDVLSLIPNLSWANGGSRPQYFLMRGIGEVEQYQGAPNPSIGFLIDDIDFSGIGMPATLFDTRQVEVLRGPQGTVYGANALGGLISVHTEDPSPDLVVRGEGTIGDFGTRAIGVAASDSLSDASAGWRIAAQQYRSNGYRYDAFLQRDDTNGYDEGTLRGKFYWRPNADLRIDLALMNVDLNDGYDAWTIDNTRTTLSNQPGVDKQQSTGASLKVSWQSAAFGELRSTTGIAHSNIVYSFDGDWGNDTYWASCCGYAPYDYFQQDRRLRSTIAQDLRVVGDDEHLLFGRIQWLGGVYFKRLTESDAQLYQADDEFAGIVQSTLDSGYEANDVATYGSLDAKLTQRSSLTFGVRAERRFARYHDSADEANPFPAQDDTMFGGNLSWQYRLAERDTAYVTLARGFKGGGFNIGQQVQADQRRFSPEYLWSLEAGINTASQDGRLQGRADVFYMRRNNMQVYSSCQLNQNDPLTYVFFTQNDAHGENYGLEAQQLWQMSRRWQLSGSVGLLHTRYLGYDGAAIACPDATPLALDGRAQSFAPGYQVSAALTYTHPSGLFGRLDGFATDGFYFAAGDNQTASAYELVNLRLGYARSHWEVSVWGRNLFDRRYAQQGFFFGLVPPNFPNQNFVQNGDPRTVGLTVRFDFGQERK
ncbi:MAG TPA: TonB-dependent receptor plug domain-containing protein [Steroidobacteraceae bacterium]|jgi:outer membrane receptor protein involved in Fe transport|nr:TonB-dependent receptor plug domain-containing protein [Steroidobacteraceae bacterium]